MGRGCLLGAIGFAESSALGSACLFNGFSSHFSARMNAIVGEMIGAFTVCTKEVSRFPGSANGSKGLGL